jgi:hypothetical protein
VIDEPCRTGQNRADRGDPTVRLLKLVSVTKDRLLELRETAKRRGHTGRAWRDDTDYALNQSTFIWLCVGTETTDDVMVCDLVVSQTDFEDYEHGEPPVRSAPPPAGTPSTSADPTYAVSATPPRTSGATSTSCSRHPYLWTATRWNRGDSRGDEAAEQGEGRKLTIQHTAVSRRRSTRAIDSLRISNVSSSTAKSSYPIGTAMGRPGSPTP